MSTAAVCLKRLRWDDYLRLPDDERWELIDGELYSMSPSPIDRHQLALGELFGVMRSYLKGKKCRAILAPMDLKLSDENVVQPDLMVVCDPRQFKGHIEGPPALVVEILSPSSESKDRHRKMLLYARFGVPEYWIVSPFPPYVEILRLHDGAYILHRAFDKGENLTSETFPGLEINLDEVFDYPMSEEESSILRFRDRRVPYPPQGVGVVGPSLEPVRQG